MKKLLLTLTIGLAAFSMLAGETTETLFKGKEFNVSLAGTYSTEAENFGGGLGLGYFFTESLGVEVASSLDNFKGTGLDNIQWGFIGRLPLNLKLEGWKMSLAPYVQGGMGFHFEKVDEVYGYAGGGLELRVTQGWGVFADASYRWFEESKNDALVRFGIRLAL